MIKEEVEMMWKVNGSVLGGGCCMEEEKGEKRTKEEREKED